MRQDAKADLRLGLTQDGWDAIKKVVTALTREVRGENENATLTGYREILEGIDFRLAEAQFEGDRDRILDKIDSRLGGVQANSDVRMALAASLLSAADRVMGGGSSLKGLDAMFERVVEGRCELRVVRTSPAAFIIIVIRKFIRKFT